MLKKLVNYYKSFGLIELLKKIKRYLIFLKNGGLYKISKKEKKYITLKDKKAYIFTYHNYKNINQKMKEVISYLNQIGFQVIYMHRKYKRGKESSIKYIQKCTTNKK